MYGQIMTVIGQIFYPIVFLTCMRSKTMPLKADSGVCTLGMLGLFPSTSSRRIRKTMEQNVQKTQDMVGSLTQSYSGPPVTRPIALVGLMGCGKSMVGRNLAAMLQMPFSDSDKAIERAAGVTVADIFDLAGEAKFREMEYREIEILLGGTPAVIATGGGAFCQPDTAALLRKKALVVWLKAKPETLLSRIGNVDSRPLLHSKHSQKQGNETPIEILTRLNDVRSPFYEQAHLHVNTDGLSKRQATAKVMTAIADNLAMTNTSKGT